jgi:hypothetical protein
VRLRQTIFFVLLLTLLAGLSTVAPAQNAERTLQLDATVERTLECATAYIAVEYEKPNTGRRYIESGTAFFVTPTCLITNYHVIAPAVTSTDATTTVRLFSGTKESRVFPGKVLKFDTRADLALVQAVGDDLPAVTPLRIHPDLPGKQTEVFAFGFPLGTMLDRSLNGPNVCLRRGYVSRLINDGKSIEADLNIDKGISGGPLVDEEGVVRGVVRAMTGSDYNQNFAAISVASPVLLGFCQTNGIQVTLRGGQVLQPGTQPVPRVSQDFEPAPRPRAGRAVDALRAFFAVGSALRLSALVPTILVKRDVDYTPDLRQSSRNNADLVLTNLQRVQAPAELIKRARDLSALLGRAQSHPSEASEKSLGLERACDEWMTSAAEDQKLNYDLGAWLTELSLGLLDLKEGRDSRACANFLRSAQDADATAEIVAVLTRIQGNLDLLAKQDNEDRRREVGKDADRLIGIGYLATNSSGQNSSPKPNPESPKHYNSSPRNPLRYPL